MSWRAAALLPPERRVERFKAIFGAEVVRPLLEKSDDLQQEVGAAALATIIERVSSSE